METVYVIETGEYEQRYIFGVADSIAAAVQHIKATYRAPYVVQWDEPSSDSADFTFLVGHFDAVVGKSTKHTASFEITAESLIRA